MNTKVSFSENVTCHYLQPNPSTGVHLNTTYAFRIKRKSPRALPSSEKKIRNRYFEILAGIPNSSEGSAGRTTGDPTER